MSSGLLAGISNPRIDDNDRGMIVVSWEEDDAAISVCFAYRNHEMTLINKGATGTPRVIKGYTFYQDTARALYRHIKGKTL